MIRAVLDFLWITIILSVLLGLLGSVVPAIGQAGSLIGMMAGAMGAGYFHARRTGAPASKGFSWKVALVATAAMLLFSALMVEWMRGSGGFPELRTISPGGYALGIAMVGVLILLVVRFFFRWGTKQGAPGA